MNHSRLWALVAFSLLGAAAAAQQWDQIGPKPIQGQGFSNLPGASAAGIVTSIAIDPGGSTDRTIYIATGAGGIWKTTNGGGSWSPKEKGMSELTTGAVALDPSNPSIVYAGLGGPWFIEGGGLYRSTDGGDHWSLRNPNSIFDGVSINVIVLPSSGTVLVGTSSGLFKSVDSGKHFGANAPKFDDGNPIPIHTPQGSISGNNIDDLKLDTANSNTVYAAVHGEGVYKSTDGGSTFPSSGKLFSPASFPSGFSGDIEIMFAQSTRPNNQTMFGFLCEGYNPESCALLKSTTGGTQWSFIQLDSGVSVNQGDYDQLVAVDPQNANGLYVAVRQIYYVSDGGAGGISKNNFIDTNGAHTDDHAIAFSPPSHYTGSPTTMYLGTDGGFAQTAANGSAPGSTWSFLNGGLSTALFYQTDMGRGNGQANAFSYGAAQDNGTSVHNPALVSGFEWQFGCCGDTFSVAVDPLNSQHGITIANEGVTNGPGGAIFCTTNGQSWSPCGNLPGSVPALHVVEYDPNGVISYAAGNGNQLYQSFDGGQNFTLIRTFKQPINVIAQVKGNPMLMWLGMNDGTLRVTTQALLGGQAKWTNVSVTKAPKQAVYGIAIDPTNSSTVVVVYPGFSPKSDPPLHVFRTTNAGKDWKNISGVAGGGDNNLPDLPVHSVAILPTTSPHTIIVGNDVGVLQTADEGKTWQVLGTGLPPVQINSLMVDTSVTPFLVRAGTWGRSTFQLTGSCPLCPPAPRCPTMTGCIGAESWSYQMTCTGVDVGIEYNGGCHDTSGEYRNCYAGFNGKSSVSVSWTGWGGAPDWLTAADQGSPTVCTENNTGQSNCKTITFGALPACPVPSGGNGPPPLCSNGEKYCLKYSPPRCVPANLCEVMPDQPAHQ